MGPASPGVEMASPYRGVCSAWLRRTWGACQHVARAFGECVLDGWVEKPRAPLLGTEYARQARVVNCLWRLPSMRRTPSARRALPGMRALRVAFRVPARR